MSQRYLKNEASNKCSEISFIDFILLRNRGDSAHDSLLFIGSAQARNDGFKKEPTVYSSSYWYFILSMAMRGRELRAKGPLNGFPCIKRAR
jgi:hypothetical protein